MRMSAASTPAMAKNNRAAPIYIRPSFLWSTVKMRFWIHAVEEPVSSPTLTGSGIR